MIALRVATAIAMLTFGLAVGKWAASLDSPATSLADAENAVRVAFPDARPVRDADVVPGYAADPAGTSIWTDTYDGYDYQGFEFPVATRPSDDARAEQMAQARARLEAAGWRTWDLGANGDFAAARDGLGLATQADSKTLVIVTVGAINPWVWPAAIVTGLGLAVLAWLLVPVAFRPQRPATVVAVACLVVMVPAMSLTLIGIVTLPVNSGLPWPAPWGEFLIGNPPASLLAALLLIGSGVAGGLSRWIRKAGRPLAGQPADVSATTDRPATAN
ncbi:MAG: hypothetical protein IRY85_17625 [Micromonosporaceae bacterium]|nr:hypothetical protein [Micromonosporaceae bacterium]